MPNYDYRCNPCNVSLTIIRAITDKEYKPNCANCSEVMTRIYDNPSVQFKGTGFYRTDNKK